MTMIPSVDFPNGILHLPLSESTTMESTAGWLDNPLRIILCVIAIICLVVSFRTFSKVLPLLRQCLAFGKSNLELEHKLPMKRNRNISVICFAPAGILIMERFRPDHVSVLTCLGALGAWCLLRLGAYAILRHKRIPHEPWNAMRNCILNSVIWFVLLEIITLMLWHSFNFGSYTFWIILLSEAGVIITLQIRQIFNILNFYYFGFSTFLYLCALEIAPLGGAVAASILLSRI